MRVEPIIKKLEKSVDELQTQLTNDVIREAKAMVLRYPFVVEYCQAMGSATFDILLGPKEIMVSIDADDPLRDVENEIEIWDLPVDASTSKLLVKFGAECSQLQKLHDAWSDHFTGSLAGTPFKFHRSGTTSREW